MVWTDLAMSFLGKEEVEAGSTLVRGLAGGTDEGEVATDAEHWGGLVGTHRAKLVVLHYRM